MTRELGVLLLCLTLGGTGTPQKVAPTRLQLLEAEARGAAGEGDLRLLLDAASSQSVALRCQAVRALGRLERPDLLEMLVVQLAAGETEVRAEAANAIAQAAGSDPGPVRRARAGLLERLRLEPEPPVVAALAEALGRLPLEDAASRLAVEEALVEASRSRAAPEAVEGVLRGLESLARVGAKKGPLSDTCRDRLSAIVSSAKGVTSEPARLRRLALSALNASGGPDAVALAAALRDQDEQVRRLAAAAPTANEAQLTAATGDRSPMVRYEALRALGRRLGSGAGLTRHSTGVCAVAAARAATDEDGHVALLAIDLLAGCGTAGVADLLAGEARGGTPAGWHRGAHALVSLAAVAPVRARPLLVRASRSEPWQARMYAARAATVVRDEKTLRRLAGDPHANVREAAVAGLSATAGHLADALYLAALGSTDNQLVITAAGALKGTPDRTRAVPALIAALNRFSGTGSDTSRDPREALAERLAELGSPVPGVPRPVAAPEPIDEALLGQLDGSVLKVTVEGLGSFEARLLPGEAPLTCLRIARLASTRYYDGLTFHRVVPNFVIQGGSPGANEFAGHDRYMRDEVGRVSQRRGTLGISTRGRHTGDAQIYVNLVDSPRLDHDYTVFAEVVRGMDVVDRVLEGAVMSRVELVTGGGSWR